MNRWKHFALVLLIAVWSSSRAAAANLLVNPGFEDPVTIDGPPYVGSWEAFDGGPGSSANNSSASPRTAVQHLDLSILNADNTFAGVLQDVPGMTPGVDVFFRMWHKTTSSPLDVGVEIRIEWRDSISDTEISRTPNSTPIPSSQYTQFTLPVVVPVGADTARVVYAIQTFGNGPTNTGTVFVDDASFTVGDQIPGDFDGDGDVDLPDYLTLSANLFTDVSALTPQQAYLLGDMTADLRIDGRDLQGFRFAYDDANGVGAFVALQRAVPEPAAGGLAAVGAAVCWLARRRALAAVVTRT